MCRTAIVLFIVMGCRSPDPVKRDAPEPACAPIAGTTVSMRKLAGKIVNGAMLVVSPPNDRRLFVLDQYGSVWILEDEQLVAEPFLDITSASGGPVVVSGEQGLLGMAFHPEYATNGQFFVYYTGANPVGGGDPFVNVVARHQVSAEDPNRADPNGTVVLSISDPYNNHNGGMIEFGLDGLLYVGTGDGGSGGDPHGNGQNPNALLAKMLRIDVDNKAPGKEYGIPPGNPFAQGGGAPEVLMMGLRNPWRWSFDRETGDLWIGDVGEVGFEEINVIPSDRLGAGINLGWDTWEGHTCYGASPGCSSTAEYVFPLDVRSRTEGWLAIIGGQVYRGSCYPDLVGWYFYTDYSLGGMSKARLRSDGTLEVVDLRGSFPDNPSSLHADAFGELYETDISGNIYRLEAGP